MKLIPDESERGLQRALVTAIWVVGTLLFGTLMIAILGLLLEVSTRTALGLWGGLAVVMLAIVVAGIVWHRHSRRAEHQLQEPKVVEGEVKAELTAIPRPATPHHSDDTAIPTLKTNEPTRTSARSSAAEPTRRGGMMELKKRFDTALEVGRFDAAERIVSELEAMPQQQQWCTNARRRLEFKRQRS